MKNYIFDLNPLSTSANSMASNSANNLCTNANLYSSTQISIRTIPTDTNFSISIGRTTGTSVCLPVGEHDNSQTDQPILHRVILSFCVESPSSNSQHKSSNFNNILCSCMQNFDISNIVLIWHSLFALLLLVTRTQRAQLLSKLKCL